MLPCDFVVSWSIFDEMIQLKIREIPDFQEIGCLENRLNFSKFPILRRLHILENGGRYVFHRQNFVDEKKSTSQFFIDNFSPKLEFRGRYFFSSTNVNFFSSTITVDINVRDCQQIHSVGALLTFRFEKKLWEVGFLK